MVSGTMGRITHKKGIFMTQPPSLASHMIVESYIKTLNQAGKFAYLRERGDAGRGLITLVFEHSDATATAYSQTRDFITNQLSLNKIQKTPIPTPDMTDWIEKQIQFDKDMWVVDIECDEKDIESTLSLFPDV